MLTPDIADQNATNQQKQHQEYQIKRSSKKQNHHQENTNKNKRCPKPEDIHHCREHQRWQTLSQAKMYPPLQRRPKMTNAVQNQKISTTAEKTKDDKRYSKPEDIHHCREEQRWPMTREPVGRSRRQPTIKNAKGRESYKKQITTRRTRIEAVQSQKGSDQEQILMLYFCTKNTNYHINFNSYSFLTIYKAQTFFLFFCTLISCIL